ncbi:MAG: RNA polymerase sigma factor [Prolixibacteraceae bacterium]|jgi:RNA polymerase sigma-70 factor (ECF subfamily)|nr:RNA polymerase sigma factor [Prolixibacteraceae bacterium]
MDNEVKILTDEELIAGIVLNNRQANFEILYKRYHAKVLDKCYGLVKNSSLAKELAEDIFSKTYEKIATFQNRSSFSSWLFSLTYNHCIDYLRKKKKLNYPEWTRANEIPEIIDESEEDLESIDYENVMEIFELIHPEEKALLLMKYQDNLSIKTIAQSLRISDDAAKMRLKRARSRVIFLYKEKFQKK